MTVIQEIYGLRYDFVHRHGLTMKLHREGGIFAEELSNLQLRMMEANNIPKLLPVEIEEIDFRINLLYHLGSKRMLSHVVKSEGLTQSQFFKLLYTILCAVDDSGNYMLNPTQYLLKENFIFVGSDITDVYLTYLPLQLVVGEIPLHSQLTVFIQQMIDKMKEEEREVCRKLIGACNEAFSMVDFKQKLLYLMSEAQKLKLSVSVSQILVKNEDAPEAGKMKEASIFYKLPEPLIQKGHRVEPQLPYPNRLETEMEQNETLMNPGLPAQRAKLIFFISIVLVLAFVWNMYLGHQTEAMIYIASGISILLLDIWFVICYIGFPASWRTIGKGESTGLDAQDLSKLMGNWSMNREENVTFQEEKPKQQMDIQRYYRELPNHTTLLSASASQATVLLAPPPLTEFLGKDRPPIVEINKDGKKEQIPIQGNSFIIGRGASEVDYTDDVIGISRLHAEIFKAVEGFGVKDLGSKNGTFLNDEQLVPYQSYKIKEGDTIRIVKTEFRLII
jgi:hypothetical protein